jgi:hypothetical protein
LFFFSFRVHYAKIRIVTKKKSRGISHLINAMNIKQETATLSQEKPHNKSPFQTNTALSECKSVVSLKLETTERDCGELSLPIYNSGSQIHVDGPSGVPWYLPLRESMIFNWQSRLVAQEEYRTLLLHQYIHTKQIVQFKIKNSNFDQAPLYPIRVLYLSGEAAHFPSQRWDWVYGMRARADPAEILYGRDIAYSTEGVRLIVSLRFPTRPGNILHVAKYIQTVVRSYFQGQQDNGRHEEKKASEQERFGFWLLSNDMAGPLPRSPKTGYNLVFKDLVVTCQQAHQILSSVRYALERRLSILGRVKDKYRKHAITQRPIFTCRRLQCSTCLSLGPGPQPDPCVLCRQCLGQRTTVGDIYAPHTFFNSSFEAVYTHNQHDLPDRITLFRDTSVVPPGLTVYSKGYAIPIGEPICVDPYLLSSHQDDLHRDYVFRQDRKILNRKYAKFTHITIDSKETQQLLTRIMRDFAQEYRRLTISRVYYNKSIFVIDINGRNRSYCGVIQGYHEKNRVYFEINLVRKKVYQSCFDEGCQQLLKNKEKKAVHSKMIGDHQIAKLTAAFRKEFK